MSKFIEQKTSLYERLGTSSKIAVIVEDIVAEHMGNPDIQKRFKPYLDTPEKLIEVKKHLHDFLCAASGGPQLYNGRDMITAHKGMNISKGEYLSAMEDIIKVLDKHQIDEESKQELLMAVFGLKDEIIKQ